MDITTTIVVETAVANDKAEALDTATVISPIHNDAVGKKIAKDFGKQGIFLERSKVSSTTVTMRNIRHLFMWWSTRMGIRKTSTSKN